MRAVTKRERQGIFFIIVGIVVFAFLTDPITNITSSLIKNDTTRFFVGLILIFAIAYWGKLNKILK